MNEHYPKSIDEVRRHFEFFDDDKNGYIDFDEYRDVLTILGHSVAAGEAARAFAEIDTDKDGSISFDEFAGWWHSLW